MVMSSFEEFKRAFKGDIITPGHPEYERSLLRWAANASRRASVVAFVKDVDDISRAVKYASTVGLPIAIRGGGHNPAGSSSTEGGLVVDLSRYMNTCRVDAANKRAYIAGGAIWETVDKETIKYGLATVGGTVNHVRANSLLITRHTQVDVDVLQTGVAG